MQYLTIEHMGQVFKIGPSKICGRQPLKNLLKAVFRKCYLVHSWILCPICFLLLVFFITEATKLSAITLVISNVFVNDNVHADQLSLTHFMPIVSFYNPLKKSENHMFPDVFRRYRKDMSGIYWVARNTVTVCLLSVVLLQYLAK